jgi:hypothetical protein
MILAAIYLLSSLLTLILIIRDEYNKGIDLTLGFLFLFIFLSLIPIVNLTWLHYAFTEVTILKGKKL